MNFYTNTIKYSTLQLKFTLKLSHKRNAKKESLKMGINKGSDSMKGMEKRL